MVCTRSGRQAGERVPCFAGDWALLPEFVHSKGVVGGYDIILAAETIYSPDSQEQLLQCIKKVTIYTPQ